MEVDEEENDQVVKEIPVYLCKDLMDKLYLFQFPCRSADCSSSLKHVSSSRVKPQSGVIELDCTLNTKNKYYDEYAGEKFASTSSKKPNPKDTKPSELLDKITYQSQRSVLKKDIPCYSVATLYDGKFCISPLQDSVSFLPSYDHVERTKKSKGRIRNVSESESPGSSENEEESAPAVQVTVKFAQRNADKTKMSQEASHHNYLAKIDEEPWCDTHYFNNTTPTALTTITGLSKTVSRKVMPMLSLSEKEYLDVLIPSDNADMAAQDD